jgi:hypothetical protein
MVTPPWQVEVRVNGSVVDPCKVALPLEVVHGRSEIGSQPDAPSCSFEWLSPSCPWRVGDSLEVWAAVQYTGATYDDPVVTYDDPAAVYDGFGGLTCRFAGVIAELTAVSAVGRVQSWAVSGDGHQARLGYAPVLLTRPQERDTARVQAVCAAAGMPLRVKGAQGVLLAAATIDSDALTVLHDICESTGGMLSQATDGTLVYETAKHRQTDSAPLGVIPCYGIEHTLEWSETVDDIINDITVRWGPADTPGESTHRDNESAAMPWGVRHTDVTTMCAAEADAEELALLVIARRAWPYWSQASGVVAHDQLEDDDRRLVNALDVGDPVLVPIPREPGPNPAEPPVPVVVEGWVETWSAGFEHFAVMAFSDQRRWVTTTLRTYGTVRDGGTYTYWTTNGDYLDLMVEGD